MLGMGENLRQLANAFKNYGLSVKFQFVNFFVHFDPKKDKHWQKHKIFMRRRKVQKPVGALGFRPL